MRRIVQRALALVFAAAAFLYYTAHFMLPIFIKTDKHS